MAKDSSELFLADLKKSVARSGQGVLDPSLLADSQTAITAAERLRGYQEFLARARAAKASGGLEGAGMDGQALSAGREALADMQALATSVTRSVGSLSSGGTVDVMSRAWLRAVKAAGGISVQELWKSAIDGNKENPLLQAGFSAASVATINEAMTSVDLRVKAKGDQLEITGSVNGAKVNARLATRPRPVLPKDAADLLQRGRFDALSGSLRQGEPAYLSGMPLSADELQVEDLFLACGLGICAEGTRHVRKLEDSGLETYAGAGPIAWGIIILVFALVLGGIALYHFLKCDDGPRQVSNSPPPPETEAHKQEREGHCVLGFVLSFMAAIFGVGAQSEFDKSSSQMIGTVLMHGVLQDYQAPAQAR